MQCTSDRLNGLERGGRGSCELGAGRGGATDDRVESCREICRWIGPPVASFPPDERNFTRFVHRSQVGTREIDLSEYASRRNIERGALEIRHHL